MRGGRFESTFLLETLEPRQMLSFDPFANEQYMLELTNRMRANPARELSLLTSSLGNPARSAEPNIDSALRQFGVVGSTLAAQWATLVSAPPLAWNADLYEAAEGHSQAMINADVQSHQLPGEPSLGDRITNAGYTGWSGAGESIYAFSRNILFGHAGFAIDWGNGVDGIQSPPGHRETMMDSRYREVGIRVLEPGIRAGKTTGPQVITQDFGVRFNQGNPFILGVAFGDSNNDSFYDAGEGLAGVTIIVDGTGGRFQTTSMTQGGWQMQVPAGRYNVTYSGGGFGAAATFIDVIVGADNVKVDGVRGVRPPVPILQVRGNSLVISAGDITPNRDDFTDFGNANRDAQTITRSFVLSNPGTQTLNLSSAIRVRITGGAAADFTLVQDAPASLARGATATVTIRFDPSAVGLRSATLTILSSDPATPSYAFSIQGRGVLRPIVQVSGNRQTITNGDSSPTTADWTNFGGVSLPGGGKVRIFTVWNTGLANLNVTGVTLTPDPANPSSPVPFEVFAIPTTPIAPGQSGQIRVRYQPTNLGFQPAVLNVLTSDPVTSTYSFTIRGTGLAAPRLEVSGGGIVLPPNSTTATLANKAAFGSLAVGQSRARLFTLRNTGVADLVLGPSFVTIAGLSGPGQFTVVPNPATIVLVPNASTTIRVRFVATAAGMSAATLAIASSDPLFRSYSFLITGLGV